MPRGTYEPNGFKVQQLGAPAHSSPLSAGNWAQRIQIHLGYAPLAANCPPTVVPDAMVGTQVAYRAVTSWQSALNQAANCTKVYSYTATTENEATNQLQERRRRERRGWRSPRSPSAARPPETAGQRPPCPTILYAPVAVTAIDFGFNINPARPAR